MISFLSWIFSIFLKQFIDQTKLCYCIIIIIIIIIIVNVSVIVIIAATVQQSSTRPTDLPVRTYKRMLIWYTYMQSDSAGSWTPSSYYEVCGLVVENSLP